VSPLWTALHLKGQQDYIYCSSSLPGNGQSGNYQTWPYNALLGDLNVSRFTRPTWRLYIHVVRCRIAHNLGVMDA
jgi:hypothetical protein